MISLVSQRGLFDLRQTTVPRGDSFVYCQVHSRADAEWVRFPERRRRGISIGTRRRYAAYASPCAATRSRSSSRIAIRMYAEVMAANRRWVTVIVGVAQNASSQPT